MSIYKNGGLFAAGMFFATTGIKVLTSDQAKEVYTKFTAAALRGQKLLMKRFETVRENAEDIYEGAKALNEVLDEGYDCADVTWDEGDMIIEPIKIEKSPAVKSVKKSVSKSTGVKTSKANTKKSSSKKTNKK